MTYQAPPIVRLAERLLVDIEQTACRFIRRHKYTFGDDIRREAFDVALLAQRAWRERKAKATLVSELVVAVDRLKLRLQTGKRISAFRSFGEFERIVLVAADLGKQVGGWNKQLHPERQDSAPPNRPAGAIADTEYPRRLSNRGAKS